MLCKRLIIAGCFIFAAITARGQIVTECPRNIGFESGSLTSWQCQTGEISGTGRNFEDLPRPARITMFSTGPSGERHRLIPRGTGIDPYGGFSLDAPNGSNYVIQLGNNNNGREAESISYIVNVPANTDEYSIIFNYAVVLENPDHEQDEQPKFTAKVIDLATGTSTECGSFEFTAPGAGGGIPGFEPSPLYYEYKLAAGQAVPDINPLNPKYRLMVSTWQKLPLPIAGVLGPRVMRSGNLPPLCTVFFCK